MKLSIITINYNNVVGLKETIKSVVSQTFSDFEYIIIDGLSNDGSQNVIAEFKNQISYSVSESDSGIYNAMNKGIMIAKGEYIYFLNSGDVFSSKTILQKILDNSNNEDFIFGGIQKRYIKRAINEYPPKKLSYGHLLRFGINHQATFSKRNLYAEYGLFDEKFKIVADWCFLLISICKYNVSYVVIDEIVSIYEPYGISSSSTELIKKEKELFIKKEFPLFEEDYKRLFKLNRITPQGFLFAFKGLLKIFANKLKFD